MLWWRLYLAHANPSNEKGTRMSYVKSLAAVIALTLVTPTSPQAQTASSQSSGDFLVVASISPLEGLVAAVLGERGRTQPIVSGTFSPHDMALQPSHIRLLAAADMVVQIDPQFEVFMQNALASISPSPSILTMTEIHGMTLLPWYEAGHDDHRDHDAHDHEDKDEDKHADAHDHHGHADAHEDAHGHADAHDDHHEHGHSHDSEFDLHIWLSPDNARLMLGAIADRLAQHMPQHRQEFRANADAASAAIAQAERAIASRLAPATRGKSYIFFHDAFGYFAEHFGITIAAVITTAPHLPLTASRVRDVQSALGDTSLACAFAEPQFALPSIPGIADLPIGILDPLGSSIAIAGDAESLHYVRHLTAMADSIIGCDR